MAACQLLLVVYSILLVYCDHCKASTDVDATVDELNKMLDAQTALLEKQKDTIGSLANRIASLEASVGQDNFVGFSAFIVGGQVALEPDDYIPFKGVESNHGNHYNPEESEFTCPTTGLYYFSVNLYSSAIQDDTDYELSAGILVVGTVTSTSIYNRNLIDSGYITVQGTVNVITKCQKGDQVWVVTLHLGNMAYGTGSAKRSTFLGMRMVNLEHEDLDTNSTESTGH